MKLKIITYPNPILNEKSKKISIIDDSIKKLAEDMAETMDNYGSEYEAGVALAAVQVGVPVRMTIIRDEEDGFYALINPEVVKTSKDEIRDLEGCMSVPQKYGYVTRPRKVKVRGTGLDGHKFEIKAEGLLARILLHEIDHMEGKLFLSLVENGEVFRLDKNGKLIKTN